MAVSALRAKARPTNADVMNAVLEMHDCLHAVDKKIDRVATDVGHVKERVAKVEGYHQGLASKFNLPVQTDEGETRPGFVRRNRTPLTIISVLAAFGTIVATYPALRVLLLAFDTYMVKAGAK